MFLKKWKKKKKSFFVFFDFEKFRFLSKIYENLGDPKYDYRFCHFFAKVTKVLGAVIPRGHIAVKHMTPEKETSCSKKNTNKKKIGFLVFFDLENVRFFEFFEIYMNIYIYAWEIVIHIYFGPFFFFFFLENPKIVFGPLLKCLYGFL